MAPSLIMTSPITPANKRLEQDSESSVLWERRHADLLAWNSVHGNCNVPKAEGKLGRWVVRQRELCKKGKLEKYRKVLLDNLGFVWNTNEAAWEHRYGLLQQYAVAHGHCCVPISDQTLGMWVAKMRANRRKDKLPLHRIKKLDAISFIWNTAEADWMDKFNKLLSFRGREGHSCVPFNEGELGWWVNTQRQCKRKSKLSSQRENLLNQAGFVWNPQQFLAERRRLTALVRPPEKRRRVNLGSPGRPSKRCKPASPTFEKRLFGHTDSYATSSANISLDDMSHIDDTPISILPGLATPVTEPSVGGSSVSGSERGEAHSCSIASILSPCPRPVPICAEVRRQSMQRRLQFPEESFMLPSFHSGHLLRTAGFRRNVAPKFVLPPISSLKKLTNIPRL